MRIAVAAIFIAGLAAMLLLFGYAASLTTIPAAATALLIDFAAVAALLDAVAVMVDGKPLRSIFLTLAAVVAVFADLALSAPAVAAGYTAALDAARAMAIIATVITALYAVLNIAGRAE